MTTTNEGQINGLKYQVARQRNMKEDYTHQLQVCETHLTKLIFKYQDEEAVWDYHKTREIMWHGDSGRLGITSTIKDYTTKGDRTFKAHFTNMGRYMGAVTKLGETPINYTGNFIVTKDKFKVEFKPDVKTIEGLFTPK